MERDADDTCHPNFFPQKEATMDTRPLGNSDLYITPIGFGAWAIGGSGWEFAWGAQDDSDSVAAIREALDNGVNWIDTAAVYGLGHSEEVVAWVLHYAAVTGAIVGARRPGQMQGVIGAAEFRLSP